MNPSVWLGYLLGRGTAIRTVAENRLSIWVGMGLVLITAIARNYDQTFIGEKPFLWLFGPLLFSVVSGTWLYALIYGEFVRRASARSGLAKPSYWGRWRCFMGLFWMTAPIAWLYAVPVERFFDSLTAAKANLVLLGVVSLWRVLLMTRVIQYLTGIAYHAVLLWVLLAAAVEILVVFFFGGAFAHAIISGMGGMRNSPEEALLLGALGRVFVTALWGTPVLLILALGITGKAKSSNLPATVKSEGGFGWVMLFGLIWLGIAIYPQQQLTRNVKLERLFAQEQFREALDYLSAHQPGQFAPARVLAPNAFEREIFTELPACFGELRADDAAWVKAHLIRRLNQMMTHYAPRWERKATLSSKPHAEQVKQISQGLSWHGPDAFGLGQLLDGLQRIPEGQAWLQSNVAFVEATRNLVGSEDRQLRRRSGQSESEAVADLISLSNRINAILLTNPAASANLPQ
jgi:hypothetical protein